MKAHQFFGEGEIGVIPRSPSAAVATRGFVVFPCSLMTNANDPVFLMGAQEVYRLAYERAKACAAPPWHLRSLLAGVN